jgi:hypothetical protein
MVSALIVLAITLAAAWLFRGGFPTRGIEYESAPGTTLIVNMTGLLLIVPPTVSTGETYVLMPGSPDDNVHRAVFKFIGHHHRICDPVDTIICVVNMTLWSVDPIGVGGTPPSATIANFPKEIPNLTHISGKKDRVNISNTPVSLVATRLMSGGPSVSTCSRGRWSYTPVGTPQTPVEGPLANLVRWVITLPASNLPLVFRSRSNPSDTAEVTLVPASGSTSIAVLLSRTPVTGEDSVPTPWSTPHHFDSLYDPLGIPKKDSRRRLPRFVDTVQTTACVADVHNFWGVLPKSYPGLDTYSCLIAAAERK